MAEEYSRAQGNCDFCGQPCDDLDELNELTCSFSGCSVHSPYHQDCVEKYLRSIKLET